MKKLTIDFETRSAADLKKIGAAAYAQHPTTEVICLALKWENYDPLIWYSPDFIQAAGKFNVHSVIEDEDLRLIVQHADIIEAHNAQFEYFIWKYVMPRYGFEMFDADKLRCSAAKAAAYGLPRDLEGACAAAGVPQQKDTDGYRLMLSLCKPRKPLKAEKLADPDWESKLYWRGTPEDFARLGMYCMQDVRAEEALSNAIPDLKPSEQKLWQLDLAVNDRGVRVDAPACEAIISGIARHTESLKKEFQMMTGLESPTQRDATLQHLLSLGVQMDGLRKADVEKALADTGTDQAPRRILEIRKSLSKSSTAKYTKFLEAKGSDDRIRGCLMFHGAGTGRWAGRLIQPQNFPRGNFADVEPCIRLFESGDLDGVKMMYGDPMAAASTCIRPMIIPADGHDFVCADYSSIEGRVLAWLAREETALDVYRSGRDPYKVAATAVYGKQYDEINKSERQIGKVAELACIAEGELVLTHEGLVPIEKVNETHLLWDGEEFVAHDGVVCKGEKDVIRYEGLTATPDHMVWVEGESEPVRFGVAATSGKRLVSSGFGRDPFWLGGGNFPREALDKKVERMLCSGSVSGVRAGVMVSLEQLAKWKEQGLPKVLAAESDTALAGQEADGGEAALHQPEGPRMEQLRSARFRVWFPIGESCGALHDRNSRTSGTLDGDRSDRQLGGVCSGESPMGDSQGEPRKPQVNGTLYPGLGSRVAAVTECRPATEKVGAESAGDICSCGGSCEAAPKELAYYKGKVRVYDIVNAGPLHRFTVSGKLVHNCGYNGGKVAFQQMGISYGVHVGDDKAQEIVTKWRASRPKTTKFWKEIERACMLAVQNPGKMYSYLGVAFKVNASGALAMRLPSGRLLWYANARIEDRMKVWGDVLPTVVYDGVNPETRKWTDLELYGGLLTENAVQAISRDLLVSGMFAVEAAGYKIVFHVHDELVAEVPEDFGSVEEFESLMCTLPAWADGLPIKSEGWRGKRYKK